MGEGESRGRSRAAGPGRAWRKGRHFAFDAFAMARFVAAVRRGALVEDAAREAKVAISTLYWRRRTAPGFAAAWDAAAAASAGAALVLSPAGAQWRLERSGRRLRFTRARKQAFLDRFAATCNLDLAARAAGVHPSTVRRHLESDGAFAAGFDQALAIGYPALEEQAVREALAAQEAYRIAFGTADEEAAAAQSFERTMAALREYKRGHGRIGRRPGDGYHKRWSFDDAMVALEKRLKIFGVRVREEDARDGEDGD